MSVTANHRAGLAWLPALLANNLGDDEGPRGHCRDENVSVHEFMAIVGDSAVAVAHRPLSPDPWPARRVTSRKGTDNLLIKLPRWAGLVPAEHPQEQTSPTKATVRGRCVKSHALGVDRPVPILPASPRPATDKSHSNFSLSSPGRGTNSPSPGLN